MLANGRGEPRASMWIAGSSRSSEKDAQEKGEGWEEKSQQRRHDVNENPRRLGANFLSGVAQGVPRYRGEVQAHGAREEEVGEAKWWLQIGRGRDGRLLPSQHSLLAGVGRLHSQDGHSCHSKASSSRFGVTRKRAMGVESECPGYVLLTILVHTCYSVCM